MTMLRLLRGLVRREINDWIKKTFTKDKVQELFWKAVGEKLKTRRMIEKIAPRLREGVLTLATVSDDGMAVQLSAADAQAILAKVYKATLEQIK